MNRPYFNPPYRHWPTIAKRIADERKTMNITEIKPQMRVAYIPGHAHGDANHRDVEHGTVSSTNEKYVFVKFDKQLNKLGWEGTTSQSCNPNDLRIIKTTP